MDLPTSSSTTVLEEETAGDNYKKNISTQTVDMWDKRYYNENRRFKYPFTHYYYENHQLKSAKYYVCEEQIRVGKKTGTQPHLIRPSFIQRRKKRPARSTSNFNKQISEWISEKKKKSNQHPNKEEGGEEEKTSKQQEQPNKEEGEQEKIVCNKCGRKFNFRRTLNKHIQHVHTPDKDKKRIHPCAKCKKTFMSTSSRNFHQKRCQ
jgi:hypothetical protein